MNKMSYKIGIIGATGNVGQEIIKVLESRKVQISKLLLFASSDQDKSIKMSNGDEIFIKKFDLDKCRECDFVFLAVPDDFSKEYAKKICCNDGPYVIDNSAAYRYDDDIPLIVPEVNGYKLKVNKSKLIANPNCTTAIAMMVLHPINNEFELKKCIISTYQSASGVGEKGSTELERHTKKILNNEDVPKDSENFIYQLPFNVIPRISSICQNNYTKEEMKVVKETKKILDLKHLLISCTSVRVPVMRAHSESITIETKKQINLKKINELLSNSPGVLVINNPELPMPINTSNIYDIKVGRIRQSLVFGEYGIDFFVVGDQLLRGAALNAVIILEYIINNKYNEK